MKTLFLAHRIPYPPNKGDKIRSYHLLVELARQGDVDLVTHVDDPRDLKHRQILADLCRRVEIYPLNPWIGRARALGALLTGAPLSVAYLTRTEVRRRVHALLASEGYDLVVGFSSQVAAYLPPDLRVPLLMDVVDVDSEKFATYAAGKGWFAGTVDRLEASRLARFERAVGERADGVVLTTTREVDLWNRRIGSGRAVAIGNGVVIPPRVPAQSVRESPLAVFVGAMDYPANVEAVEVAAREVWPLVRAARPEAVFRIVGRNPHPRVSVLSSLPGIEVTGEVADLRAHLEAAQVSLVPLRVARGVQNKVLEALAYGVPVVTSREVAESLRQEASEALFVGQSAEQWADRVLALFADATLRERSGAAARAYVTSHHDWRSFDRGFAETIAAIRREPRARARAATAGPVLGGAA